MKEREVPPFRVAARFPLSETSLGPGTGVCFRDCWCPSLDTCGLCECLQSKARWTDVVLQFILYCVNKRFFEYLNHLLKCWVAFAKRIFISWLNRWSLPPCLRFQFSLTGTRYLPANCEWVFYGWNKLQMRPLELGEPVAVYSFPAVCVLFLFVWLYSVSAWLYRNYAFSALCQEMHPSSEQTIFHRGKENVLFHTNKITVNTTAGRQLSLCSQKCPERHVCVTDPHSSVSAGALLKAQTLNRECSLAGVSVSCCAVCIRGYCFSSVCAPPGRSTDFFLQWGKPC